MCDGAHIPLAAQVIEPCLLLPEYQKKGIGRKMMETLCAQLPVQNIILYAAPGRGTFYRKCGFRKMLTAMAMLHPRMSNPDAGYLEAYSPNKAQEAIR